MIPKARLHNQHITHPHSGTAAALVASFGAVQAQEYPCAKWGLALRLGDGTTDGDIEAAFAEGQILRTHVMRPTWHFVTPNDITWMLELTALRVRTTTASYFRKLGLDDRTLTGSAALIERALAGGRHLTRAELASTLAGSRMKLPVSQLGAVLFHAELERVICSGPRRGKHGTYALLSERVADALALQRKRKTKATTVRVPGEREEAVAELARRFFSRHGPATVRDFVWWSGLKTADARRGIDIIHAQPFSSDGLTYWSVGDLDPVSARPDRVHLLPIYDEYIVAYRDRKAVLHNPATLRAHKGSVTFRHAVIIDGQVAGTWRTRQKGSDTVVEVTPLRPLKRSDRRDIEAAIERYRRFRAAG